jgi:hypothetical protein
MRPVTLMNAAMLHEVSVAGFKGRLAMTGSDGGLMR